MSEDDIRADDLIIRARKLAWARIRILSTTIPLLICTAACTYVGFSAHLRGFWPIFDLLVGAVNLALAIWIARKVLSVKVPSFIPGPRCLLGIHSMLEHHTVTIDASELRPRPAHRCCVRCRVGCDVPMIPFNRELALTLGIPRGGVEVIEATFYPDGSLQLERLPRNGNGVSRPLR